MQERFGRLWKQSGLGVSQINSTLAVEWKNFPGAYILGVLVVCVKGPETHGGCPRFDSAEPCWMDKSTERWVWQPARPSHWFLGTPSLYSSVFFSLCAFPYKPLSEFHRSLFFGGSQSHRINWQLLELLKVLQQRFSNISGQVAPSQG